MRAHSVPDRAKTSCDQKLLLELIDAPINLNLLAIRSSYQVIFTVKICIFERSNEKSHFSKTKIYFHKKTTPQLLEHIGLQNMKVGEKTNFGRLATIFQICSMDADILS